jgi:hypothetical protein
MTDLPKLNGAEHSEPAPASPLPSLFRGPEGPAWVVNGDDKHAVSAAQKLAGVGLKPGIIIKLTMDEFAAVKAGKLMRIL